MTLSRGRAYRIPLARPAYLGNEVQYVTHALVHRNLTHGDYVERFEAACASYLKVEHAIAVSSGTAGLHLALQVVGVEPGNTVLTTPLTYVASANAITYCGADPKFHDVLPTTWTLDAFDVAEWGECAVLLVDLYGLPAATPPHGMRVVYDACEAFGATYEGRPITCRGGISVFSFYANKILTTGEGGLVTTDDDTVAARLRQLRGQGQSQIRRYWHEVVGYNYRMTNLQGALGLAQIEQIDEHLRRRRLVEAHYFDRLGDAVQTQVAPVGVEAAPWLFACLVRDAAQRDAVMRALWTQDIESRPVFPCLHQMPAHQTRDRFPIAEAISARGVVLPLYAEMTEGEVDEVCDVVLQEIRR